MAIDHEDFWKLPPLSADDQQLIAAYEEVGKPLEGLAYTPEFETLVRKLGRPDTLDQKHLVFQRLLQLRKMGRLPRLGRTPAETF